MNFPYPVIIPLLTFLDYSNKQVTSHLCTLQAKYFGVKPGGWSNWEWPSYHCRNEKLLLTLVSHLTGKPYASTNHYFIFPSYIFLFLVSLPFLFYFPWVVFCLMNQVFFILYDVIHVSCSHQDDFILKIVSGHLQGTVRGLDLVSSEQRTSAGAQLNSQQVGWPVCRGLRRTCEKQPWRLG